MLTIHKRKLGSFLTTEIVVNGSRITALVDTGAVKTIIDKTVVELNGREKRVTIYGFNGKGVDCYKRHLTVTIKSTKPIKVVVPVIITNLDHINKNYGKSCDIRAIVGMDIITKTKWLNITDYATKTTIHV